MRSAHNMVEQRRADVLEFVLGKGRISVEEVAKVFAISEMTARRDLQILESENLLKRTHGGAVAPNLIVENGEIDEVLSEDAVKSREIVSRRAADLVEDGEVAAPRSICSNMWATNGYRFLRTMAGQSVKRILMA